MGLALSGDALVLGELVRLFAEGISEMRGFRYRLSVVCLGRAGFDALAGG
ncbi:hypothetical protein GCM10011585_05890 [Edaphobacter dinghuensis]|uniref:Uncharacterized protein n=1 Tax=Edaphobacter dinghuensis TaxID=1560005 RepID=A0A917H514_9BACT|nr:hypothetical protein GCM10011585_05890 [Edaphobacter dinghuensis]